MPTEWRDENQQPTGKGVNDLTDKSGLRVIEAKGLSIFVGDTDLPEVGDRPKKEHFPSAQTIEIKHQSGTKIKIADDGALTIESASGKTISIKIGNNTIKMSDKGIEINAETISLTSTGELKISSSNLKADSSGMKVS